MQSRRYQIFLVGLLLALPILLPQTTAEEVGTQATVRNAYPQILTFEVLFDARLGLFLYEVRASDGNGAPDLDRAIFHFLDRDDRVWTHTDADGMRDGNTMTWSGVAHAGEGLARAPFRVHLHVYDHYGAETDAEAPVTVLSPALDTLRDPPPRPLEKKGVTDARALIPLLHDATIAAAPQTGVVILFALLLFGTVLFAWRRTRPPTQRRSGGRPGGR